MSSDFADPNVKSAVPPGQKDEDDWFNLDKYREAAGVAYEFSKKKMEDAGGQERQTAEQQDTFRRKDEERDSGQAQRAYRY